MARVRISDVAREAGASVGTASNALDHPDKVRPETLERISAAILARQSAKEGTWT